MEIIATNALISINETAIVQLVSFLIFLYVMNRIMFRPLLSTISQRKELISDFQKDIISGKEDLVRVGKDLDREQAKVIQEAQNVVLSLETEGDQRASDILEDARQQISELRHETETRVKDQVRQARMELAGEVEAITLTIMEKVLHRRL
ncbi:ATP synthase F0 subunit B [Desulfosarcina sp.]|uniref:ATP synthase F0 subunit B n=1 Tax=Desulfosarcina sp. TaxID=2027861 RepID=UPI0029A34794|nr:ATP synthase F0 subunit B [Desulfosarcina sp.]MDX2451720.1 ATP synthase F0 subunit B [Desulfosarcina sp.]MDX2489507.1 ATP synthase F0 subunit B [Desulfosarcina sp.]